MTPSHPPHEWTPVVRLPEGYDEIVHDPYSCWLGQGSGPARGQEPYCTGGDDCKPPLESEDV